jgi:hypothetical protein
MAAARLPAGTAPIENRRATGVSGPPFGATIFAETAYHPAAGARAGWPATVIRAATRLVAAAASWSVASGCGSPARTGSVWPLSERSIRTFARAGMNVGACLPFQEVRPPVASIRSDVASGSDGTTTSTAEVQARFFGVNAATTAADDVVSAATCWEAGAATDASQRGSPSASPGDSIAGVIGAAERLTRDSSRSSSIGRTALRRRPPRPRPKESRWAMLAAFMTTVWRGVK